MPWPRKIIDAFATVRLHKESSYYGPYNMLLSDLFPSDQGFMVCPQHQVESRNDAIDLAMTYLVEKDAHVVFFMEVKVPGHLSNPSTREAADGQMRQRYTELFAGVGYVLHAVSAMGTKLCFYKVSPPDGKIEPGAIGPSLEYVTDVAPASRWRHDLLEPEGESWLRDVANEVTKISLRL